MKRFISIAALLTFAAVCAYIILGKMSLFNRFLIPLLYCVFLCVVRLVMDATAPERTVSVDILGIIILGICAILAVFTGESFYMDIALAWALQSFIGMLALAKYLEGRKLDE